MYMIHQVIELIASFCKHLLIVTQFIPDSNFIAKLTHEFVMHSRPWTSGDFLAALSSRPKTEKREIVDELFLRIEAQFRDEPTMFNQDAPTA